MGKMTKAQRPKPWPWMPQPTPEEIVGEALAKLHRDLAPYRRITPAGRQALEAADGQ